MATKPKLEIGPIDRVPCAWCKKPNDCRGLEGDGFSLVAHNEHPTVQCDHCGNFSRVERVDRRPRIIVKAVKSAQA